MSTKIYFIFSFLPLLFILTKSQLTLQDKSILENYIYQSQSKTTGLFFEEHDPLKHTKEAISVLNILGIQVKYSKEICKKISENDKIDVESLSIDKLLNCKNNFKPYKPDLSKPKLLDLYQEGQIMNMLNVGKWDELFTKTKNYMMQENGKFSPFKIKEGKKKSILDMIVYLEKGIPSYKLNYHVINSLKLAKKIGADIPTLNNHLYHLLNYFNTFKYEMISNIDNAFYLINIYKLLEKVPLMFINKESFNYLKEKSIKIQFENIFGEKINVQDSTLNIKLSENEEKNPKLGDKSAKKKSSYDLEDDDDGKSNLGETKKEIKISEKKTEVDLDLSNMIKGPGYFTISITLKIKNNGLIEHLQKNIRSYSEVKIESVDFEIRDKIHDENNQRFPTLNNPNKITKEMKANQDCSLIARVKISSQGKKPTIMEQVFLRLRNKELNKSYNAYASKFDPDSNQYFIGFELDDPVNMESYNGAYEIFIVMSDPTIENILTWEFGEIMISFTKPTDPLDEQKSLKNYMQPKMEPTFTPEVKREKNMVIATVFSGIICILTILLIVVLVKSDSNIRNFPRSSFASLMNMLFVCILFIIAYILFLFWTKYNILQIMFCFVVISLPVCFIVYKALKNHQIEIVPDKDDDE